MSSARVLLAWFFLTWGIGAGDVAAVGPYRGAFHCAVGRVVFLLRHPRAEMTVCFDGDQVQP
jgi:hypothetical protein